MPGQPIIPAPDPAAAPAPAAEAPVTRTELADFQGKLVEAIHGHAQGINQQFQRWSQNFQGAPAAPAAPARPATPAGDGDDNSLLMRIARGDLGGIDERVVETLKGTGLVSYLATQAQSAASANDAAARASIDAEFGEGTYEKHVKPIVDSVLGDSVAVRSNPVAHNNAVAAAKGQRFNELVTARTAKETAAAAARAAEETRLRANAPWMPSNGYLPAVPNTLSEDDGARLRRIGDQTGGNVPKAEEAAKLRDLLWQNGSDGVSITELAKLFPNAGV